MQRRGDGPRRAPMGPYDAHMLRRVVASRLGEPQAVEEVMQDVALAAVSQRSPLRDPARGAVWLYRLALRRRKRPGTDRPAYAQRRSTPSSAPVGEAVLAGIPGISTSYARALLARFGSVTGIVEAGPAAWLEVPGIGPERVRALERALTVEGAGPDPPPP